MLGACCGGLRTLREAPPPHLFDVVLSGYVDLAPIRICTMKWKTLETTFKHKHFNEKAWCVSFVLACFGVGLGPLGATWGQACVAEAWWGGLSGTFGDARKRWRTPPVYAIWGARSSASETQK